MKNLRATYGQYAIVTGASSGIGEEFARQLATAGINVVLVARREDRLQALAEELSRTYGTANEVVALNLIADGAVTELCRRVADLDVGIVIANAGITVAGPLVKNSLDQERDVLTLDGAVPLQLAHHFGREFTKRGRGAIVLVSSMIAASPVPYLTNYSAVKAYILSLGQALNYELKKDGVDVLVLSPGATQTEGMTDTAGIDFDKLGGPVMDVSRVVTAALKNLGKRSHVIPGAANNFTDLIVRYLMPRRLSIKLYGRLIHRALDESVTSA